MSPWVSFVVLVLCFSFSVVSDARHRKQLPSPAVLVGTVYCDTCFHQEASKSTHFISGATVAVECGGSSQKPTFHKEVNTNAKGEFKAKLPLSISKDINKVKGCSVRLIRSGSPYCAVAATAASSEIHFKSKHGGTHIFSAGFFTFKPELCSQKDSNPNDFPPALPDPPAPFLPPLGGGLLPPLPVPDLPIPPLVPPLPRVPGVPLPPLNNQKPSKTNKLSDQKIFGFPFPPNPLQPPVFPPLPLVPSPPSLIPPLPFQPPPPALLPPLIPSPPPASVFPPLFPPLPPLPGLIPSPPPPPPPAFPIPLPPIPLIPGLPPVPPSRKTTP